MSDELRRALVEAIDSPVVEKLAALFAPAPGMPGKSLGESIVDVIWPSLQWRLAQRLETLTDAQVAAGLEAALAFMQEKGVTALSPFEGYPSPSETIRRVHGAIVKDLIGANP